MEDKKIELKKVKKVVVNRLNTRTGVKALGGAGTKISCFTCYTK